MPRLGIERGTPPKAAMYGATAEALAEALRAKEPFDVDDADFAASQSLVWLDSACHEARRARERG